MPASDAWLGLKSSPFDAFNAWLRAGSRGGSDRSAGPRRRSLGPPASRRSAAGLRPAPSRSGRGGRRGSAGCPARRSGSDRPHPAAGPRCGPPSGPGSVWCSPGRCSGSRHAPGRRLGGRARTGSGRRDQPASPHPQNDEAPEGRSHRGATMQNYILRSRKSWRSIGLPPNLKNASVSLFLRATTSLFRSQIALASLTLRAFAAALAANLSLIFPSTSDIERRGTPSFWYALTTACLTSDRSASNHSPRCFLPLRRRCAAASTACASYPGTGKTSISFISCGHPIWRSDSLTGGSKAQPTLWKPSHSMM